MRLFQFAAVTLGIVTFVANATANQQTAAHSPDCDEKKGCGDLTVSVTLTHSPANQEIEYEEQEYEEQNSTTDKRNLEKLHKNKFTI